MWCRNVRSQLSAYADGELTSAEVQAVEEHLGRCRRCESTLESIRQVTALTALVPLEEPPASMHERLMMRLAYADAVPAAPVAAPRRLTLPRAPLWLAAGAPLGMAAAALVLTISNRGPAPKPHFAAAPPVPRQPQVAVTSEQPEPVAPRKTASASRPVAPKPTVQAASGEAEQPKPAMAATAVEKPKIAPASPVITPRSRVVARAPRIERPSPAVKAPPSRPEPVPVVTATGKPTTEPRGAEPTASILTSPSSATPGEPVVNATSVSGQAEPVVAMAEKDGMMMMAAGPGSGDAAPPAEELDGERALRQFLEERVRSVPQPPSLDGTGNRRMRRSL